MLKVKELLSAEVKKIEDPEGMVKTIEAEFTSKDSTASLVDNV